MRRSSRNWPTRSEAGHTQQLSFGKWNRANSKADGIPGPGSRPTHPAAFVGCLCNIGKFEDLPARGRRRRRPAGRSSILRLRAVPIPHRVDAPRPGARGWRRDRSGGACSRRRWCRDRSWAGLRNGGDAAQGTSRVPGLRPARSGARLIVSRGMAMARNAGGRRWAGMSRPRRVAGLSPTRLAVNGPHIAGHPIHPMTAEHATGQKQHRDYSDLRPDRRRLRMGQSRSPGGAAKAVLSPSSPPPERPRPHSHAGAPGFRGGSAPVV